MISLESIKSAVEDVNGTNEVVTNCILYGLLKSYYVLEDVNFSLSTCHTRDNYTTNINKERYNILKDSKCVYKFKKRLFLTEEFINKVKKYNALYKVI